MLQRPNCTDLTQVIDFDTTVINYVTVRLLLFSKRTTHTLTYWQYTDVLSTSKRFTYPAPIFAVLSDLPSFIPENVCAKYLKISTYSTSRKFPWHPSIKRFWGFSGPISGDNRFHHDPSAAIAPCNSNNAKQRPSASLRRPGVGDSDTRYTVPMEQARPYSSCSSKNVGSTGSSSSNRSLSEESGQELVAMTQRDRGQSTRSNRRNPTDDWGTNDNKKDIQTIGRPHTLLHSKSKQKVADAAFGVVDQKPSSELQRVLVLVLPSV